MTAVILCDCSEDDFGEYVLLKSLCDEISMAYELRWVNVGDLNIGTCKKCHRCRPHGDCVLPEDDAHRVGRMIFAADALVVGLNTTVDALGGKFVNLFERISASLNFKNKKGEICPWHQGRSAVVVHSEEKSFSASEKQINNRPDESYLLQTLSAGGFNLIGTVSPYNNHSTSINDLSIDKARALGRSLSNAMPV